MIFGMTYYQICWYFLWYSFLGWIVEVVFHAVTQGKVINRGFLNGPVCPIYGFGVVSVFCLNGYVSQLGSEINDLYLCGILHHLAILHPFGCSYYAYLCEELFGCSFGIKIGMVSAFGTLCDVFC